jgi:hypothetical protein
MRPTAGGAFTLPSIGWLAWDTKGRGDESATIGGNVGHGRRLKIRASVVSALNLGIDPAPVLVDLQEFAMSLERIDTVTDNKRVKSDEHMRDFFLEHAALFPARC